jgi:hypothetical protein
MNARRRSHSRSKKRSSSNRCKNIKIIADESFNKAIELEVLEKIEERSIIWMDTYNLIFKCMRTGHEDVNKQRLSKHYIGVLNKNLKQFNHILKKKHVEIYNKKWKYWYISADAEMNYIKTMYLMREHLVGRSKNIKDQTKCAVCLDELKSMKRTMKCGHKFHIKCILPWKKSNTTCPLCREQI